MTQLRVKSECVTKVMRSGTELAWKFQLTNKSKAGNQSNRSPGVHICTRFGRYLYSMKCSWIIIYTGILQCQLQNIFKHMTLLTTCKQKCLIEYKVYY